MFIVEALTTEGRICETYATHEEALHRVEGLPNHILITLPLIFQELPDGSQRLVREDGKPLQWHRHDMSEMAPEPVELADGPPLGPPRTLSLPKDDIDEDEEPLPLV
jgi:hypothetical protein